MVPVCTRRVASGQSPKGSRWARWTVARLGALRECARVATEPMQHAGRPGAAPIAVKRAQQSCHVAARPCERCLGPGARPARPLSRTRGGAAAAMVQVSREGLPHSIGGARGGSGAPRRRPAIPEAPIDARQPDGRPGSPGRRHDGDMQAWSVPGACGFPRPPAPRRGAPAAGQWPRRRRAPPRGLPRPRPPRPAPAARRRLTPLLLLLPCLQPTGRLQVPPVPGGGPPRAHREGC